MAEVTQSEIGQKQKLHTVLEAVNELLKPHGWNIEWSVDCESTSAAWTGISAMKYYTLIKLHELIRDGSKNRAKQQSEISLVSNISQASKILEASLPNMQLLHEILPSFLI